ncbi:MAG TPA: type II toxin-antitoxin system RelE/ParE family toxin [Dongiaceae bacterium]|nr:type II toxin-antitoxin system RelE/ParE family toxin [Dongiaceae bacterium]
MNLVVKSPVWDDLREIGLRIAEGNPGAAERFVRAAQDSFELIRRHPRIGRLRSFSVVGMRSWVIPDFQNYLIFYLPTGTEVQVLAVLHGARDLASALAERLD